MHLRLWLICFIFSSLQLCAGGNLNAHDYPFIIVTSDTVKQLPPFTDQQFYSISTGVIFKVAKTDINPNDPFLELYRNEIVPMINQGHLQLRKIYIRGAASPEGPYKFNQWLGKNRTQALLTELQKELRFQYLEPEIDLSSVTEDYGYLCLLMEEANDPDYRTVKQIYDHCNGDELTCKQQLQSAQGGKLWFRLLKQYFPQLRAARMVMWFSEPDQAHAPLSLAISGIQSQPLTIPEPTLSGTPALLAEIPTTQQPIIKQRQRLLAVRTNLAHDFFYMPQFGWAFSPNLQLEYFPRTGHYTYNIGFTWSNHRHWSSHEFFQIRDLQLEVRRYFKGEAQFTGGYLGLYLHGDKYGIGLSESKGWQGEGGGGGLSIGYTVSLNKRKSLRLEFMAAVGYYLTYYDPYVWGDPRNGDTSNDWYFYDTTLNKNQYKERNNKFTWIGPTNFGIQITYDILYRKRRIVQKGDSL